MIYEGPGSQSGEWDRFLARYLGYKVQQRMAEQFHGDAQQFRRAAVGDTERTLGIKAPPPGSPEHGGFENFAVVLSLISDLGDWAVSEKDQVRHVLQAKMVEDDGLSESAYVRLLNSAPRLRKHIIRLGSANADRR